jgi:hypothetical protein
MDGKITGEEIRFKMDGAPSGKDPLSSLQAASRGIPSRGARRRNLARCMGRDPHPFNRPAIAPQD